MLARLLGIYEIAHPMLVWPGVLRGYPDMALTAFALVVFGSAFGAGFGLVASTLIRDEDLRQAGAATAAGPSDAASSQKTKPPARTIFGLSAAADGDRSCRAQRTTREPDAAAQRGLSRSPAGNSPIATCGRWHLRS